MALFQSSPALETLSAISLLINPAHHGFAQAWAADLEAALSANGRHALALVRQMPKIIAFSDVLRRHSLRVSPEDLAERIGAEPPDRVVHHWCEETLTIDEVRTYLTRPHDGARAMLKLWPQWLGGDQAAALLLFERPHAIRDAYAQLVREVWPLGVQPKLAELEPLWEACLEELRSRDLPPRALATEVFGRPFARRFDPGHEFDTIIFAPSYFISPHKAVLFDEATCIAVADCRLGPAGLQQRRDELLAAWKAVADATRIDILRLCKRDRQYGQSLANQLKLKPATINHHLDILREQGLLNESVDGAVKYLTTNEGRLDALMTNLKLYLAEAL